MTPAPFVAPLLTDHAAMAALLQRKLPGCREGRWTIEQCRIGRMSRGLARAAAAPYMGISYRLEARDTHTGHQDAQWLYGKAYPRGLSEDAYRNAFPAHCVIPHIGEPVMHVPELGLVLWSLPNDPSILHLPAFLDATAVRPHLPLARLFGAAAAAEVEVAAPRIVRHAPERHCTARFALAHGQVRTAVFGRCYAGEKWRDVRDCLDALWRHASADPQAFLVGRPLGSSAALHAIWQEELTGRPLAAALAGPDAASVVEALAAALGRLHADGQVAGRTEWHERTLELARGWAKALARADERLAPALATVLARLERDARAPRRLVPVHGDFHVDQMMWCEGRVALFDYDHFALGSPARDLADFASHLLCREDIDANWPAVAARLVARYRAQAAGVPDDADLAWHLRFMLLRRAYAFFEGTPAGWAERAQHALAMAKAGLGALPSA